ncbi:cyanophycinase [Adhaeribacter rhizoryzae]|uniref:Cyanophycinase n=1 Tax=Adhaeribacter rhizoryzae TaxID=2607907 RepID=A0A5M6DNP0_9BACT|nr:cyanophycinase [Adhaeribacter rhizoryzae]KAA5547800.1 cyanophycinase [Adhaeribacter rhizoryzae]
MPKAETKQKENGQRLPVPKGKLLSIGGKEDKGLTPKERQSVDFHNLEILKRFVAELKGENPMIALIPTASSVPDEMVQDYKEVFRKLKVNNIEVVDIRNRQDAKDPAYYDIIDRAAGIFITGGDQLKLTALLGGTPLLQRIKERYTFEPIVVAGTSAGAAAMSTPMIYEGEVQGGMIKGDVKVTTGLEFLKDVAIDTHFIARGRIVRMAQAIATNPGCIGIGLEEDTAILVSDGGTFEVIGSGLITVVDGMDISHTNIYEIGNGEPFTVRGLHVHLLRSGDTYKIPTYEQLHI